MGASSEIRYKIGADTSAFSKGMVALGTIAEGAGKAIERKLGIKDAFKSSVIALGISIDGIAKKIAAVFSGGSIDAWREGLDSAVQATDMILQKQLARLDTARQLAALEREIATTARDEDPAPRKPALTGLLGKLGPNMQRNLRETFSNLGVGQYETEADAFKRSQAAQVRRLQLEKMVQDVRQKGEDNIKRIEEVRRSNSLIGIEPEKKLVALIEDEKALIKELFETRKKGADTAQLELDILAKQKSIKDTMLEIERASTAEADKRMKLAAKNFDSAQANYRSYLSKGELSNQKENLFSDAVSLRSKRMDDAIAERKARFEDAMGIRARILDSGNFGERSRAVLLPQLENKPEKMSGVIKPDSGEKLDNAAQKLTDAAAELKEAASATKEAMQPSEVD